MIPSYNDFESLAKTSRDIDSIIYWQKITKEMSFYHDFQSINIRVKEGTSDGLNVIKIENINIERDRRFYREEENFINFYGERFLRSNCTMIFYSNWIEGYLESERKLFVAKIFNEINLNCQLRENTKFLDILIDFSYHHSIILYVLSKLKHPNIERIKITDSVFMAHKTNEYNQLESNMFEGFSNLHELEIGCIFFSHYYKRLLKNTSVLEHVFNDLSKKKEATLILTFAPCEYDNMIKLIDLTTKIIGKYKIKLKCNLNHVLETIDGTNNINYTPRVFSYLSINKYITSLTIGVRNSRYFINIMRNLQVFTNLESLQLEFLFFNLTKNINVEERCKKNHLSIKNITKLTKLKLYFSDFLNKNKNINIKKFLTNFKYLISLMPTTIQKLELVLVPMLNEKVVKVINKCLPNITILRTNRVILNDINCLMPLGNLKILICHQDLPLKVPDTVELFGIKKRFTLYDEKHMSKYEQLIESYTEKFTKKIQDTNQRCIFFNDVKKWNYYKCVIEEDFW
ncbi:Hypothetical protein SRAE_2000158500 [Strongyloides ratti]|uniref:Uncharacterized protein n=1 Tax=Strongyloides ratti TaxID=34506 RepID=A0A090MYC0_STRRB|nr:Hypothetical protein SRAE_2000158500 [Strongyloides ratti]CEF66919.1 Hypothetical protein SRAE_2000158500 [Strongyloides ratti]